MTDLKVFARTMGMTVGELANFCGYTRQGLYALFGDNDHNNARYNAAIEKLKLYAKAVHDDQTRKSEDILKKRLAAIDFCRERGRNDAG